MSNVSIFDMKIVSLVVFLFPIILFAEECLDYKEVKSTYKVAAPIYAAVGTMIVLLIGAGVMISRMKKEDELPNVPASNELEQLEKQIEELEKKKSEMLEEQDPTELMFED